jgi:hypothetical protein
MNGESEPPDTTNSNTDTEASLADDAELQEGLDYYLEDGLLVFTAAFLLRRGYCCDSGCRHCPYQKSVHSDLEPE